MNWLIKVGKNDTIKCDDERRNLFLVKITILNDTIAKQIFIILYITTQLVY